MPNRLADATSPYLRQHADNPVAWFPWGDAAFAVARERDVPVFLSVGYSSCHWCHVMAHESFEDDDVAAVLNERFVSIKVDREERPDVDAVYMDATVAMTGHGGWPMSVFCDHEGRPFLAGTYWPKDDRGNMPGFLRVLDAVHEAWTGERDRILQSAQSIAHQLRERARQRPAGVPSTADLQPAARLVVEHAWDRASGGFGRAPKFPQAMTIGFLLDHAARTGDERPLEAASHSLDAMARGGIHDQVGGGFARYATDAHWLVPHFEKMLYDNALLVEVYAQAAVQDRDAERALAHARTARRIARYLDREMTTADGALFAATDADSEGVEGRFFTWTRDEYRAALAGLDVDAGLFAAFHGVSHQGNWEGTNVLHEPQARAAFCRQRGLDLARFEEQLLRVERALLQRRAERTRPGLDDKVLTSWNGLAIRGLARAGMLLDDVGLVEQASRAAAFLLEHHVEIGPDGDVASAWHTSPGRRTADAAPPAPRVGAFLDDLAHLAAGLLALHDATGAVRWFTAAVALAERCVRDHRDDDGSYVQTSLGTEPEGEPALWMAPRARHDNATPSATATLAGVFVRLHALTGRGTWADRLDDLVASSGADVLRNPTGHGELLRALEFQAAGPREVAIVGPPDDARAALVAEVRGRVLPGTVVAVSEVPPPAGAPPLLDGRTLVAGAPAAYVCRAMACERPVTTPAELRRLLDAATG